MAQTIEIAPPTAAAPQKEIVVSQIPPPAAPSAPPKPGSAKARLHDELKKKGGVATTTSPEPVKSPAEAPKPVDKAPERPGDKEAPAKVEDSPQTEPAPKTEPVATDKDKKVSPWKLADHYKDRAAKAELRASELEKQLLPEPERKAQSERLERAEARAKELEDEMRYVNYAKSQEFKDKYQTPYESAWKRAMSELHEITVEDPATQQKRAVTANDLLELVQMPLGKAREIADSVFGVFADDVMGHRKEIRTLFEAQSQALEEAKTKGAERETQRKEQYQKLHGAVSQQVKETWDKVNSGILEDPANGEYFKPREGDEDWNQRLGKGFQLVDRAFSENPMDPRLSTEQRADIIKRHAAVRNRAAGWGPLKLENGKLKAKIDEMEGELKKYKESTPAAGGTVTSSAIATNGSAKDRLHQGLRALMTK